MLEAAYTTLFGDVVLEAPEPKYTRYRWILAGEHTASQLGRHRDI